MYVRRSAVCIVSLESPCFTVMYFLSRLVESQVRYSCYSCLSCLLWGDIIKTQRHKPDVFWKGHPRKIYITIEWCGGPAIVHNQNTDQLQIRCLKGIFTANFLLYIFAALMKGKLSLIVIHEDSPRASGRRQNNSLVCVLCCVKLYCVLLCCVYLWCNVDVLWVFWCVFPGASWIIIMIILS